MIIKILAKDIEISSESREYIESKIETINKYLEKFSQDEIKCDIEICKQTKHHSHGEIYHSSANLYLPGKVIRVDKEGESLRESVDKLRDILKKEVLKYKERNIK